MLGSWVNTEEVNATPLAGLYKKRLQILEQYTIIYITIWTAGGCGQNCYGLDNTPVQTYQISRLDNTPVQTCQSVRLSVISITELTLK